MAKVARHVCWSVALVVLTGCVSKTRSHFDGKAWSGAFARQVEDPWLGYPAAALLVATPLLLSNDSRTQAEVTEDTLQKNNVTRNGDYAAAGLALAASGIGIGSWMDGDEGRSLEVLAESFFVVQAMTMALKYGVARERPDRTSNDSFPSGHTSFACSMATLTARAVDDMTDEWYGKLGYLAYVPAAFVGVNRMEGNRHFSTDVTFGAFLGIFATNLIYDAHYGSEKYPGMFEPRRGPQLSLEPAFDQNGASLTMVLRF